MLAVVIAGYTGLLTAAPPDTTDLAPWSVQASYRQNADAPVLDQPYEPKQTTFTVQRRIDGNTHAGAGHEYRVLDLPRINGIKADANGDLHRLGAGFRRDAELLRYRLAVGVAVSSNALKYFDLEAEDVRAAGAIEYRVSERWSLGLYGDDRFGRFRLYPGFELFAQPATSHQLRIGFPESSWRWQLTPSLRSELGIAPDGGRWRVRDADTDEHPSIVRQNAWEVAWALRWQFAGAFSIEGRIGRTFDTTLRYQLSNGVEARVDPPDSNFAGLAVSARF